MNILIDTNILLPLEPSTEKDLETKTESVTELFRLCMSAGHRLFYHPDIRLDLERDKDSARASLRKVLLAKYHELPNPPRIKAGDPDVFEGTEPGSNDWVDNQLLFALYKDAIDVLVSDDEGIHKKAKRLGLQDRTKRSFEFLIELRELYDVTPEPPPTVNSAKAHVLNEKDVIFNSLREDYPGFDEWLAGAKRKQRDCYFIEGNQGNLAAFCILKPEPKNDYGFSGKVLKICTFKVGEQYSGNRYGELILKPVFDYLFENNYDLAYVTVFEKHEKLLIFLESFGFEDSGKKSGLGEKVLCKRFKFSKVEFEALEPLEFNKKFGPWITKFAGNKTFVVPIRPDFHRLLFPELPDPLPDPQGEMFNLQRPCGNSIKKAYLSNSKIKKLNKGDNIFFYRSEDYQAVTCLGIVEETLSSRDPEVIARYVGDRTVYQFREITKMCQKNVLAIKFRRVQFFDPWIGFKELLEKKVLNGWPQSIVEIEGEGLKWLITQTRT